MRVRLVVVVVTRYNKGATDEGKRLYKRAINEEPIVTDNIFIVKEVASDNNNEIIKGKIKGINFMFNREDGFIKDIGIFLMTRIGVITITDMQVREMKDVREGHI